MTSSHDAFGYDEPVVDRQSDPVYDVIIPFLMRLRGREGQDTIYWPAKQRMAQIDEFIKKLKGYR